jgi:hypothetical protein
MHTFTINTLKRNSLLNRDNLMNPICSVSDAAELSTFDEIDKLQRFL